jgi:hypothetical protein
MNIVFFVSPVLESAEFGAKHPPPTQPAVAHRRRSFISGRKEGGGGKEVLPGRVLARWGQGVGVLIPSPLHQAEQFTPGPSNRAGGSLAPLCQRGGHLSPLSAGGRAPTLPHCSAILSVFVLSTGLTDTRYNVEFSNRAES